MTLQACRECGAQVSTHARVCPLCGVRSPASAPKRPGRYFGIYLMALALLAFLAIAVWIDHQYVSGLPACEAKNAITMLNKVLEDAPAGRVLGLKIVDLRNTMEISRSGTEVQCAAVVKLNDASQGELRYRFYSENGNVFVEAQLPQ